MGNLKEPKTLFVAGGGGFAWESKQILTSFDNNEVGYVLFYPSESYEFRAFFKARNAVLIDSITHRDGFRVQHISNFFRSLLVVRTHFKKHKITTVIGMGASLSIIAFIFGRFYGCNTIFIESVTRTESLSSTGKLLLKLGLTKQVLVQWPEMEDASKSIFYKGNVL